MGLLLIIAFVLIEAAAITVLGYSLDAEIDAVEAAATASSAPAFAR